ncbi:hypothetical protein PWEIH_14876 [Listeria weihenstephanensis FSL R9-0317]|uniref:Uncharacterized protein n=1 Tax=Listeria weihenstephanensis TaxID=1006155 RepID=A0A1S7FVL1_9LIST|nr:hypothetical protein [Listeria weihenstephanensis]AQY51478.1 hypothetical protein UE46_10810 [Listeria weihenstephanensis]EUJ35837.1 hypothetical protein PWEIH_14876 [Listeria weihenstephanensis FSL R9-0317]
MSSNWKLDEVDSVSLLSHCDVMLGETVEARGCYYSLELHDGMQIGLVGAGHGLVPQVLGVSVNKYVVGIDDNVYFIDSETGEASTQILNSLVYEFFIFERSIIVVCELDSYSFSFNFDRNWVVSLDDVVIDFSLRAGKLLIETESGSYVVDLVSGYIIG